jgi:hypothetical protein
VTQEVQSRIHDFGLLSSFTGNFDQPLVLGTTAVTERIRLKSEFLGLCPGQGQDLLLHFSHPGSGDERGPSLQGCSEEYIRSKVLPETTEC